MDAVKFLKMKEKMCDFYKSKEEGCYSCGLSSANNNKQIGCSFFIMRYPEEAVKVVENFDKNHLHKTIFDDFMKKHPNAPLEDGVPMICPSTLGYSNAKLCDLRTNCKDCWNTPLKEDK